MNRTCEGHLQHSGGHRQTASFAHFCVWRLEDGAGDSQLAEGKLSSYKVEVWQETSNLKTHALKKNPKENRRGIAGDSARQDPDVMLKWQLPRNLLHAPTSLSSRHTSHASLLHTHTLLFFFRILDSHPNINTRFPSPPWYPLLLALYLRSISDVHSGSRAVFYSLYECLTVGTACCLFSPDTHISVSLLATDRWMAGWRPCTLFWVESWLCGATVNASKSQITCELASAERQEYEYIGNTDIQISNLSISSSWLSLPFVLYFQFTISAMYSLLLANCLGYCSPLLFSYLLSVNFPSHPLLLAN